MFCSPKKYQPITVEKAKKNMHIAINGCPNPPRPISKAFCVSAMPLSFVSMTPVTKITKAVMFSTRKVSMNTLMVDVTDAPDVKSGDEVVLFGQQGKAEISQAEVEDINGALLADLYTVWGNSNPKILVEK